jgi:hypothetical protein
MAGEPMNPATKRLRDGRRSRAARRLLDTAARMTTILSAIVMASIWSW